MKIFIVIFLFLSAIGLNSFKNYSFTIDLTGRLKRDSRDTSTSVSHIPVFVKFAGKIIGRTISKRNGVFYLTWNDGGDGTFRPYSFYCIVRKKDTLLLAKVVRFASDTPDLTFLVPFKSP